MTIKEALAYEVAGSWWAGWFGNTRLQNLAATYFAWKVNRKFRRFKRSTESHYAFWKVEARDIAPKLNASVADSVP